MKNVIFIILGFLLAFLLGFYINYYYIKTSKHPSYYKVPTTETTVVSEVESQSCNVDILELKGNKVIGKVDGGDLQISYKGNPTTIKEDGSFEIVCK